MTAPILGTAPRLQSKHLRGACADQRALFRHTFPDGAPLTVRSVDRAVRAGLDVRWLVRLLPAPARAEYERATAPAWAEYERAPASA